MSMKPAMMEYMDHIVDYRQEDLSPMKSRRLSDTSYSMSSSFSSASSFSLSCMVRSFPTTSSLTPSIQLSLNAGANGRPPHRRRSCSVSIVEVSLIPQMSVSSASMGALPDEDDDGNYEFPPIIRRSSLLSLSPGVGSLKRSGTSLQSRRDSVSSSARSSDLNHRPDDDGILISF
jgi:hypothetical protein